MEQLDNSCRVMERIGDGGAIVQGHRGPNLSGHLGDQDR